MQAHKPSVENKKRWEKIMTATSRIDHDGLSNVHKLTKILSIKKFKKFTRLTVDVVHGDVEANKENIFLSYF
jgi:hypothetical protein